MPAGEGLSGCARRPASSACAHTRSIHTPTHSHTLTHRYKSISELPEGAVLGSASLRRQAQILAKYPTLQVGGRQGRKLGQSVLWRGGGLGPSGP